MQVTFSLMANDFNVAVNCCCRKDHVHVEDRNTECEEFVLGLQNKVIKSRNYFVEGGVIDHKKNMKVFPCSVTVDFQRQPWERK